MINKNIIQSLFFSSRRDIIHDLGPMIWHTTGTIAALLFEIVSTYQFVNPPTMSLQQVTRLCNALALLQCVGAHPDTRSQFLKAQIPLYMYPFLHNANKCRNFEHLRLTSLGVIGALVKVNIKLFKNHVYLIFRYLLKFILDILKMIYFNTDG